MRRRLFAGIALLALAMPAAAQRRVEQFYYPGSFNWSFLRNFPEAARLFNAFDYGHAVLYEHLYASPERATLLLEREYRFLTTDLLVRPPRFAVAEEAVMPSYARAAWRAKAMFDWAHLLHRQIYDVYADPRMPPADKPALVERLTDLYLANRDLAFTEAPKDMALMDEQHFSQVFRKAHPRFNGLIWAYHWLQVGLYEPLIAETEPAARKSGVQETLSRFWAMLDSAPSRMPEVMPMTAAVAPRFSERHPRAAIVFDNLHMMHDIISDVLASDRISRAEKGAEIERQLAEFRDPGRNLMSLEHWRMMGEMMGGVEKMGGVAYPGRSAAPKPPAQEHRHPPG